MFQNVKGPRTGAHNAPCPSCVSSTCVPNHIVPVCMQDMDVALAAACPDGVHVVYEGVGGAIRATALKHLAPNGRLLQV